jgi:hypothetical protein
MAWTDTLGTISDTLGNVQEQVSWEAPNSEIDELTDQQMRNRKRIRIIVGIVLAGALATLLIYTLKRRK